MNTLTITNLIKHFEANTEYLKSPPQLWDLKQVLKYIEQDNYNQLLFDYGEIYCLLVLDMFEQLEEYDVCAEIIRQINTHNEVSETSYKTNLKQIIKK